MDKLKLPKIGKDGFTVVGVRGDDVVAAIAAELPMLRSTVNGDDCFVGLLIVMRHSQKKWIECGPPSTVTEPAHGQDARQALRTMLCDAVEATLNQPEAWSFSANLPRFVFTTPAQVGRAR